MALFLGSASGTCISIEAFRFPEARMTVILESVTQVDNIYVLGRCLRLAVDGPYFPPTGSFIP